MTTRQPPDLTLRQPPADYQEDEIDLRDLLGTLIDAKWLILAVTVAVALIGVGYALIATPIYQSDALLQVEDKNSGLTGLQEISSLLTGETPAEAEIEIIRSRSVVGAAVDQLKLDIVAAPKYFPLIGAAIARRYKDTGEPSDPILGLSSYAWGGESIQVDRLEVPLELEDEALELIAGAEGQYQILDPDGQLLITGEADKPATASTSEQPGVAVFVASLRAREGTRFILIKRPRIQVIGDLQESLKVAEKGKKTGIIAVSLEGAKAAQTAATVDAIANLYLRQNVERRSEEAHKMLEFLNSQLPELKANLDIAEAALNNYRSKKGAVDLSLEARNYLEQLAEIEKQISVLEMQRAELAQKFTGKHPALVALEQQAAQLKATREAVNAQFKNLPEAEQEALRLARDATVANELYVLLLNKAQELKVAKAGTIGNVRILDSALRPDEPVKPKKDLIVALSLVLGTMLGILIAFARRALQRGIEDPDQVEQQFGVPVYAVIPHSEVQRKLLHQVQRKQHTGPAVLAHLQSKDLAIESLRSLRTSLQFALMEAKNNIITIGGPAPNIGKSFVALNLAHVIADAGKRILLIDGDLRKGHLHEYLARERSPGLSEAISGELQLTAAIRETDHPNVRFMATGILPPNPSELLLSDRFNRLLSEVSKQYDLVLVDCPPVIAVTDGAIIARHAGTNFLVIRAGQHTLREIGVALKRLEQNGVRPQGMVFNDMPQRVGVYRYGYGKYGYYHYQYDSAK